MENKLIEKYKRLNEQCKRLERLEKRCENVIESYHKMRLQNFLIGFGFGLMMASILSSWASEYDVYLGYVCYVGFCILLSWNVLFNEQEMGKRGKINNGI